MKSPHSKKALLPSLWTHNKAVDICLVITYSAFVLLLAVITLDAWLAPKHFWPVWGLQTLPLLMLCPGLLYKHYRSYSWLCFLMLAYFTSYVVQVYSPHRHLYDWLGLALTVIVFIAAMLASRWLQRLPSTTPP